MAVQVVAGEDVICCQVVGSGRSGLWFNSIVAIVDKR